MSPRVFLMILAGNQFEFLSKGKSAVQGNDMHRWHRPCARQIWELLMARVSRKEAAASKEAILESAARLFKERGFKGVSIADLMDSMGRTHGGLYRHYPSKEDLILSSVHKAFDDSAAVISGACSAENINLVLRAFGSYFLDHLVEADIGKVCPSVLFAVDADREHIGSPMREAFQSGLNDLIGSVEKMASDGPMSVNRKRLLSVLVVAVGATMLVRATRGDALSDELLDVAYDQISRLTESG
ncbi:TetR/AcrR family transcriptional regulator [Paraburkholderia caribensis]|uniref:TetR/AcrR family transcriptional regulator n=1 Tax=Paraburkholderia caribensis TaxID=75105 RepID=UPI0034D1633F